MQCRTLGRTGLIVSEVGIGGAQLGLTNCTDTIHGRVRASN